MWLLVADLDEYLMTPEPIKSISEASDGLTILIYLGGGGSRVRFMGSRIGQSLVCTFGPHIYFCSSNSWHHSMWYETHFILMGTRAADKVVQ